MVISLLVTEILNAIRNLVCAGHLRKWEFSHAPDLTLGSNSLQCERGRPWHSGRMQGRGGNVAGGQVGLG